jgi:hypothetical protein
MSPVLSVTNDRSHDLEILQANIFTPGQGICLQRLAPGNSPKFKFDYHLAYGSWYDIQIIARSNSNDKTESQRYLIKGVYLSIDKTVRMTALTDENHRDHGIAWECSSCNETNIGSVVICEHCHTNKAQTYLAMFSIIPIVGIPFSVTDSVLRCGKAAQSNKTSDQIDAGVTVIFAAIDIITAPFIIGALVKIPGKVAAQNGIKLTAKTVFTEAGKPLLKELITEFGKDGIMGGVKIAKMFVQSVVQKTHEKK